MCGFSQTYTYTTLASPLLGGTVITLIGRNVTQIEVLSLHWTGGRGAIRVALLIGMTPTNGMAAYITINKRGRTEKSRSGTDMESRTQKLSSQNRSRVSRWRPG